MTYQAPSFDPLQDPIAPEIWVPDNTWKPDEESFELQPEPEGEREASVSSEVRNALGLELFALDGVLTNRDLKGALNGSYEATAEVPIYLISACEWICSQIRGLDLDAMITEVQHLSANRVFPNRKGAGYWSEPGIERMASSKAKIAPALDHVEVTKYAISLYLDSVLEREGESDLGNEIRRFTQAPWAKRMYEHSLSSSVDYCEIDQDALQVLTERVRAGALVAIVTDSDFSRVEAMLSSAGLDDLIVRDAVKEGRIGVLARAEKWKIEEVETKDILTAGRKTVDLSQYYDDPVVVDLRRGAFKRKLEMLMEEAGVDHVKLITAAPELDGFPVMNWKELNPRVGILTGPNSIQQGVDAAIDHWGAPVRNKLAALVAEMD